MTLHQSFKKQLILTLIPALLWLGAVRSRAHTLKPWCAESPTVCTENSLNALDRSTLKMDVPHADSYSYTTQNLSGYLLLGAPLALHLTRVALSSLNPATATVLILEDFLIGIQSVSWNGALNETARLIVQRPRPFVYNDSKTYGGNPGNYTSFYSGHTSFASSANTALILTFLARNAPKPLVLGAIVAGTTLTVLTGFFRVASTRHFITDVLVGALMGFMVSLAVSRIKRRKERV